MTAPVFVDTNVLIYAMDEADPNKHAAARIWRAELWRSGRGRVSFQVLQEFYTKVVQKWPSSREQARAEARDLLAWLPVTVDGGLVELGWKIQDRFRLSFWDALIVAAAKVSSSRYLLTEDLQAGQDFDGVLVVHPFQGEPGRSLPNEAGGKRPSASPFMPKEAPMAHRHGAPQRLKPPNDFDTCGTVETVP